MTIVESAPATPLETPRYGTLLFSLNAVIAWLAVLLSLTLAIAGYYVDMVNPAKLTILGNTAAGVDTPLERVLDWSTYFTILSNVVVAVVTTALVARPGWFTRTDRTGTVWRTLRLDSVLMIVITGVVYNLLLATGDKTSWDLLSNALLHMIVPLLTLVVWIVAGPRGLITGRVIAYSLVLPLLWASYALVRGQAVGAYPYPFLDVSTNGWASVLVFIVVIVVVAVLIALVMWAVDAGLRWTLRERTIVPVEPAAEQAGD